jgi:tight adherence protein C
MEFVILLVFASIVAFGGAVASFGRRPEQRRLAKLASGETTQAASEAESVLTRDDRSWIERLMGSFAGNVQESDKTTAPIRRRLIHAGYRRENAIITYMGSRIALALGLPIVLLMFPATWGLDQLQLIVALCAAAGIGLVAPSYWLDKKVQARQLAIEQALPDALDLMVVCVEAGLGINASMKRIADDFRTSHPLLANEFELASFETRAGKRTTEALRGLADRTGVSDVSSLVAMLIQTERFGTGLADTLRVHADAMRKRRLLRAEEMANKAPLKMLLPTVLIFVAMMIVILGPGFLQMAQYFSSSNK